MSETNETPKAKKTRATLNKAVQDILDRIKSYITPYDEEAQRARLSTMPGVTPEVLETIVANAKALAAKKVTAEEREKLAAEFHARATAFYAARSKGPRQRTTLPFVVEACLIAGKSPNDLFFEVEDFCATQVDGDEDEDATK